MAENDNIPDDVKAQVSAIKLPPSVKSAGDVSSSDELRPQEPTTKEELDALKAAQEKAKRSFVIE